MTTTTNLNELARQLKALHKPGEPLLLANVHDAPSGTLVASLPNVKAIATASYAVAAVQGIEDDDLTLDANLTGIRYVVAGLKKANKYNVLPLTADMQDGYEDIAKTIQEIIKLGVVGANIEDLDNSAKPRPTLRPLPEAVARIKTALKAAADAGVPDFVINARTDVLGYGGTIQDAVERGKAYLEAGATAAFVWGVRTVNLTEDNITELVKGLNGQVSAQPGILSIPTLQKLGVCRVSVGPMLLFKALPTIQSDAEKILAGTYAPS